MLYATRVSLTAFPQAWHRAEPPSADRVPGSCSGPHSALQPWPHCWPGRSHFPSRPVARVLFY